MTLLEAIAYLGIGCAVGGVACLLAGRWAAVLSGSDRRELTLRGEILAACNRRYPAPAPADHALRAETLYLLGLSDDGLIQLAERLSAQRPARREMTDVELARRLVVTQRKDGQR